jgi:hypothetical protein
MTINELKKELAAGHSDVDIMRRHGMSKRTYNSMKGRMQRRIERESFRPIEHQEIAVVAKPVLVAPDGQGVYWTGVFDAVGALDVKINPAIQISARISTRHFSLAKGFHARYGGKEIEAQGMYSVVVSHEDAGLHRLIADLSESQLYSDKANKLVQWLEYRFYINELERAVIESFGK